jgi:hypothetical protein
MIKKRKRYFGTESLDLGLSIPHLGPNGEMAQEFYDHEEMSEYLGVCLVCGAPMGLIGCQGCGDIPCGDSEFE